MSSVASLRERKSTRIDYKNLPLGKPGRNMAADENGDFIIEEMTSVRMRFFKSIMLYRRPRQRMVIVMMLMMLMIQN